MAPKKKQKTGTLNSKPGVGRQHLHDNFENLPTDPEDLQNCHVLHVVLLLCEHLQAKTVKHLKEHFSTLPNSLPIDIKKLQFQNDKFHKLTDETEFTKYALFCQELFTAISFQSQRTFTGLIPSASVSSPRAEQPMETGNELTTYLLSLHQICSKL